MKFIDEQDWSGGFIPWLKWTLGVFHVCMGCNLILKRNEGLRNNDVKSGAICKDCAPTYLKTFPDANLKQY